MAHAPRRPWYRELWPWLLAAGPIVVIVAGMATAWLAVSTDDGLVAEDYYKRGLLINKTLERQGRGESLGLGAIVEAARDGAITVELASDAQSAPAPATLRVRFAHRTRAVADIVLQLERGRDGVYVARPGTLPPGRWLVTVETDAWRLPSAEIASPGTGYLGTQRNAR
jgi:uncharacterized protein